MFPALTSEFMTAENDYRYNRSQRSFREHAGTKRQQRDAALHQQPPAGRNLT